MEAEAEESDSTITLVTWNINGIRSVYKNSSEIKQGLDAFQADVMCFQETQVSRDVLPESTAIVEGYNSYYAFPWNRIGYSGVATYCRNNFTPFKAEEGISSVFACNSKYDVGCYGNINTKFSRSVQIDLDLEGRAVITQHKFTVPGCQEERDLAVINVYCPRDDPDNDLSLQMKLMFYDLLETRVRGLMESGSHVMIAGDINTVHKPIDHCDPSELEKSLNPCRMWLNNILWDPEKGSSTEPKSEDAQFQLIDAFRYMHPMEEKAFTYWSTKLNARPTNNGTRIDYILIDPGLKVRVKECSILRDVTGSDHCPVKIVLNINGVRSPSVPTFCTKYYLEFFQALFKKTETGITIMQPKEHEDSNPDGERKRKLSPENTETKRQKGTEQFLVESTTLLENVSASSDLVKFHSSETASSSSQHEDCIVITENTGSASSVTVLESEPLDANLSSTSCCTASVSDAKKGEDTEELK